MGHSPACIEKMVRNPARLSNRISVIVRIIDLISHRISFGIIQWGDRTQ